MSTVKNQTGQAKDSAHQATDKAREAAGHAGDAAQSAAGAIGQQARDAAGAVADKARDAMSAVGQHAESATSTVAGGLHTAAGAVRDNLPREGYVGTASRTVADGLESASKYLDDKNLSGMVDDMSGLIRRNPVPAVLIGLGIGFLVGRALSSSNSSRSWS